MSLKSVRMKAIRSGNVVRNHEDMLRQSLACNRAVAKAPAVASESGIPVAAADAEAEREVAAKVLLALEGEDVAEKREEARLAREQAMQHFRVQEAAHVKAQGEQREKANTDASARIQSMLDADGEQPADVAANVGRSDDDNDGSEAVIGTVEEREEEQRRLMRERRLKRRGGAADGKQVADNLVVASSSVQPLRPDGAQTVDDDIVDEAVVKKRTLEDDELEKRRLQRERRKQRRVADDTSGAVAEITGATGVVASDVVVHDNPSIVRQSVVEDLETMSDPVTAQDRKTAPEDDAERRRLQRERRQQHRNVATIND